MDPKEIGTDSIDRATGFRNQQINSNIRDIFIVLIVSWAARLAFMWLVPAGARSFDEVAWEKQAVLFIGGTNPYMADEFFSWPPFWMQMVFALSKIAIALNVHFFHVLQICLIVAESAVIVQVMRLIQRIAPTANARAIVMIGIALNPAPILLVCQHCNFDVFIGLWVSLAAASLLRYNASGNLIDWLCACMFLGLGILTKTVPLALVPLLAGGFRKATVTGRFLGTSLVFGPTALGMSIIYVLGPAGGMHVLEYRAKGVYFGFPGLLHGMGLDNFAGCFDCAFYILGIGVMVLTCRYLWEHNALGNRETILYIALVFLAIPGLGPGFGSQYYYWFLPFFVISYALYGGLWRKLLIGFAIISAINFIIEYGLNPAYGFNFLYLLSHAHNAHELDQWTMTTKNSFCLRVINWEVWMASSSNQTIERIPLFIAVLTIIAFGGRILLRNLQDIRKQVMGLAGVYALCVGMVFVVAIGTKFLWPPAPGAANPNSSQSGQNQNTVQN